MKYQFQFAGVNESRPSMSSRKRWRFWSLGVLVVALAGVAYWQYLHHLTQNKVLAVPVAVSASHSAAVTKLVTVKEDSTQIPATLKKATAAGLTALWDHLTESVNLSAMPAQPQVVPITAPVSQQEVASMPTVAIPVVKVVSQPVAHRPPLSLTSEQRLQRAGQIAMDNMLDQANKYPDAYGFRAEDNFVQAKLGKAIPVYTIEEKDRANYQSGQPLKPLLKLANQWVFPVLAGDRMCCMVQVKYDGREYVPDRASKLLAAAWVRIQEQWPASQGYNPYLVVNPKIPGYYFTIPELPVPNVTDIMQMSYPKPEVSPATVILGSWR